MTSDCALILNFDKAFDVKVFDKVVTSFYHGTGATQVEAAESLKEFQEHPDSWLRVAEIIESSRNQNSKFIALQVLDRFIQTRWNSLPREHAVGIRNFIVSVIINIAKDDDSLRNEKLVLNKLNITLVQILKKEWPKNWPSFITEIANSSRASLSICENNMNILRILSEESFDFSMEQLTSVRAKRLKTQLCNEFSEIFKLCSEILEKAQRTTLLRATFEAFQRFLRWMPLGYIFETPLLNTMTTRFLESPDFRNFCLSCLSEICLLPITDEYASSIVHIFNAVLSGLEKIVPYDTKLDLASIYSQCNDSDSLYIKNVAILFSSCFSRHLLLLERSLDTNVIIRVHFYLLKITLINDTEIFKICLEHWQKLVAELFRELPYASLEAAPLFIGHLTQTDSRYLKYLGVLSGLREIMIERMVKPEEVLIVEDENGEIIRERVRGTETLELYKCLREVLVYLTHLDCLDIERIISDKLSKQIDGSEWSWNNLNKICWAVGSISGAMNETIEERFIVTIIKDLLGLVEMKRGKDNKAVIASNIMYVVGQYPRFLRQHWKFLKTVVNKLFEFMHEYHEGVRDMACDTFLKISTKCKRQFVMLQPLEEKPFIEDILSRIPTIICDLEPHQVHTVYESLGCILQSQSNNDVFVAYIDSLMHLPNQSWCAIIESIKASQTVLSDIDTLKSLVNILKTNISVCKSLGGRFLSQINRLYLDLFTLYRTISANMSSIIASSGVHMSHTILIKVMRSVKKEILKLIDVFVTGMDNPSLFTDEYLNYLFEMTLIDYKENIKEAREYEVLNVTSSIIAKLGSRVEHYISPILDSVFECTLNMINKDFSEYPDHRLSFFKLLGAIINNCFDSFSVLPLSRLRLFMDSISWAIKHPHRQVSALGLEVLSSIITKFNVSSQENCNQFHKCFYITILQDLLFVMSDSEHRAGKIYFFLELDEVSMVLCLLFYTMTSGKITISLSGSENDGSSNQQFINTLALKVLASAFPHLKV